MYLQTKKGSMKICFLCNYPLTDLTADYILRLGNLLNEGNNEVIIIAQTNHYIYHKALEQELSILPIKSHEEELTIKATYNLNQSLKMEAPGALFIFNKENISAGVLLKKAALPEKARLIFWQTEIFSEKNKGFWAGLKKSVWESKMLKRLDYWIAPLNIGADIFEDYTSLSKKKLKYLFPNLQLLFNTDVEALKKELKIPADETLIGLIEEKKLLDDAITLINCIAKLRDKGYEVNGVILLAEGGIYSSKRLGLYQHAIEKQVEHHIEILSKEQLNEQAFIHLSDILLVPEPSLFRTLEAYSAGTLTILPKHPISDLLNERGDLGLTSKFEAKKLAKQITEYLDDELFSDIVSAKSVRKMHEKAIERAYASSILEILNKA